MKKVIFTLTIFVAAVAGNAQIKVGPAPTTIDPSAMLQVDAASSGTRGGLLLPRVALQATNNFAPLASHVAGMTVYNTATAGTAPYQVTPGYYFNDGKKWVKLLGTVTDQTVEVLGGTVAQTSPTTFTGYTFSPNTPASEDVIYIDTLNGSMWTYNGSTYESYTPPPATEWYLNKGTIDAGTNKKNAIYRTGAVGIGTNNNPAPSAILDVNSTTQGFLPPRMTNAQMKAIANPVDGLVVYNTTLNCLALYSQGSYNCSYNKPAYAAPAPATINGSTYTAHYNGIVSGVSVDNTLATYSSGETFDQNTTCASKPISAQGCGGLTTVTGASGTVYNLVNINGQCWIKENLKEIPSNFSSYTATSWLATSPGDQGYWGYYNTTYTTGASGWGISVPAAGEGYLYQWNAAMDNSVTERTRGACPTGFHVPSDCEFMYLEHGQGMALSEQIINNAWRSNTTDNQGTPSYKLRSQGTGQTNASGFSGLLAGYRSTGGSFFDRGNFGDWWLSSATGSTTASYRGLFTGSRGVYRSSISKAYGFSLRCLKD